MEVLKPAEIVSYDLRKEVSDDGDRYYQKGSRRVYLKLSKDATKAEIVIEPSSYDIASVAQKQLNKIEHALDTLSFTIKKMIEDKVLKE